MKKITILLIVLTVIITFLGCTYDSIEFDEYIPSPFITFEEVSQPYLDLYGTPEDIYTYDSNSGDYHAVDWWWWSKGFEVSFSNTPYDDINGWIVNSEYTFPPFNL